MTASRLHALSVAVLVALAAACGGNDEKKPAGPYDGTPPLGTAIGQTEGTAIGTDWRWVDFPETEALCTNNDGTTSATGIAISWSPTASTDLVVYLAGGGACWDYATCGLAAAATTGPFAAAQFQGFLNDARYTNSWVHRTNMPAALANATVVFVPYCTGDVHTGDKVTTYSYPPFADITWHHYGHRNLMAFLKRLGRTFTNPAKLVVAGSSAGGFGALANYPAFKWYWPNAKSYLVDDSGPPLIGDAVPAASRAAWYANWNMGATLDAFCSECRTDLSAGMRNLKQRYPNDRIALLSHLEDATIRYFFAAYPYLTPVSATTFKTQLQALGTTVIDPGGTGNAKYFFSNQPSSTTHPMLLDPSLVVSASTGSLTDWIHLMISDDGGWTSVTDP